MWRLIEQGKSFPATFGSDKFSSIFWEKFNNNQSGGRAVVNVEPQNPIQQQQQYKQTINRQKSSSFSLSDQSSESDYYEISDPINTYVKRYGIHGKAYTLRFKNFHRMQDASRVLLEAFRRMLQLASRNWNPSDRIGLQIRHPSFHKRAYNVPFVKLTELTPDRIFALWEQLTMSNEDLALDSDLFFVFTRIADTVGGRPGNTKWNHRAWMEKHCSGHGGCFIKVNNPDDNLYLARAIVVAKARIDKQTDPSVQWHAIRKNHKEKPHSNYIQKQLAQKLMRDAGLENYQGECGEDEIAKLQAVLEPEYQIKIFSAQCCNFLTYQGKIVSEKVLHLYHDVNDDGSGDHFLVISAPHVLFNSEYWCDKCNKGYNTKQKHKCVDKCQCCFALNECKFEKWIECSTCNRWFKSESCFENHTKTSIQNGSKKTALDSINMSENPQMPSM